MIFINYQYRNDCISLEWLRNLAPITNRTYKGEDIMTPTEQDNDSLQLCNFCNCTTRGNPTCGRCGAWREGTGLEEPNSSNYSGGIMTPTDKELVK